ncbi:MAG: pentapeptide repeat-containing protein [Thermodesulfobacteriota bacterium]|nr:pentapeptide repeat-containing protein [Thermodesulfobacteriota bacterium]
MEEPILTKKEVISLKSRWNKKNSNGGETTLQQMIDQLKTQCRKNNFKRPLHLDLRGISLLHEDLSDLDLSGYDLSYANLDQSNLTGTVLGYTKFHRQA